MERVSESEIAKTRPEAICCDCGKCASASGQRLWTVVGPHLRCERCSAWEGAY